MHELEQVSQYDESIHDIEKRIKSNRIDLEDLVLELQGIQKNIVINKDDLEKLNDIIIHIEMLKRKYGGSMDAVIEYKDNIIKAQRESESCKTEITTGDPLDQIGYIVRTSERGIEVGTTDGRIIITELQLEGKKRMDAKSFLAGNQLVPGDKFDSKVLSNILS